MNWEINRITNENKPKQCLLWTLHNGVG